MICSLLTSLLLLSVFLTIGNCFSSIITNKKNKIGICFSINSNSNNNNNNNDNNNNNNNNIANNVDMMINDNPITCLKQRKTKFLLTKEWELPNKICDIRHLLSKYDSFVPIIGRNSLDSRNYLDIRQDMFNIGIYPGIEYRIVDITLDKKNISMSSVIGLIKKIANNNSSFTKYIINYDNNDDIDRNEKNIIIDNENDLTLHVRPVYPLIEELERYWPIEIKLNQVPYFLSKGMYNSLTVLVSLTTSMSFFMFCIVLSNLFTLSFVNSKSMQPTIMPGDLILVEKISPIITRDLLKIKAAKENDIVFFKQPPTLVKYIKEQENKEINKNRRKTMNSDLIVKRIKTIKSVTDEEGHIINYYDVRGDNPPYSADSRVFGLLDEKYIVGNGLFKIFPFQNIGLLK